MATKSAVAHDKAKRPALTGTFTVDGKTYVTEFELLKEQMAEYTLDWAAGMSGVPAETIAQIAEEYAAGPSIIANGVGGIDKYNNNDVAGHAYAVLASLTGNYGKRGTGCGFFHFNPTPYNAGLSESVFEDIADAIRAQNGLSTQYAPGDMAAAILALSWDVGLKPRAVLSSTGVLEFNYVDRRRIVSGGTPVDAWEVSTSGYSSAASRPWESSKLLVKKVVFDSPFAQVGLTNASYLCNAFQNMTEVVGFENLNGITSANQMFGSCPMLESIYAASFSNSGLSASMMLNGCNRLVGGTDGFVPSSTLTDLYYTFSSCSSLTTIYADSTWALPSSGISGSQCFYSCSNSLVGGNGTVWSNANTGYTYFRIDEASHAGYLTAA